MLKAVIAVVMSLISNLGAAATVTYTERGVSEINGLDVRGISYNVRFRPYQGPWVDESSYVFGEDTDAARDATLGIISALNAAAESAYVGPGLIDANTLALWLDPIVYPINTYFWVLASTGGSTSDVAWFAERGDSQPPYWRFNRGASLPGNTGLGTSELHAQFSIVPIPPAVWLFGSALGVMGVMRRKATA